MDKRKREEEPGPSKRTNPSIINTDDEDDEDFVNPPSRVPNIIQSDDDDDDLETLDESASGKWICGLCNGKEFKNQNSLKSHNYNKHSDRNTEFTCSTCGKSFKTKTHLEVHMGTHNRGNFDCDQCDYVGSTPNALSSHKFRTHSEEEFEHLCSICDRGFVSAHLLRNHLKIHAVQPESEPRNPDQIIIGSQTDNSQALSEISMDQKEGESANIVRRAIVTRNKRAVLVMTAWKTGTESQKIKTAVTAILEGNSIAYSRIVSRRNLFQPPMEHLTHKPSSLFVTGDDADASANLILSVIKVTQFLLDVAFKFNKFVRPTYLDINSWNPTFFKTFVESNGLKLLLEPEADYISRKGSNVNFSSYYRNKEWISKSPEPSDGHIYLAYFKFLDKLYLYIGINEENSTNQIQAKVHNDFNTDTTALGIFLHQKKVTHPKITIDVKAKILVNCSRKKTRRQLESATIMAAVFASEEEIFLDPNHNGPFELLNKRDEVEDFSPPYLQCMRYVTYMLFKSLSIRYEGEGRYIHVDSSCVGDYFENVARF